MPITIICPNLVCRSLLRVPDDVRGKKVRCGQCNTVFSVPAKKPVVTPKQQDEAAVTDASGG